MGDIVQLRSPIDTNTDLGRAFVVDATRAGEGLLTDQELQEKYELSPADWLAITKDKAIGRAVRSESERRVRNGTAAREAAAKHFLYAPAVLNQIMTDADSNPRHKIEAIKELRATANGGSEKGPAPGELFSIVINLGSDHVEKYEVDITPKPQVDLKQEDNGNWG